MGKTFMATPRHATRTANPVTEPDTKPAPFEPKPAEPTPLPGPLTRPPGIPEREPGPAPKA